MNVLVTGGAGYIGSHAVRRLVELNHRVIVLDDLSKGHREAVDAKATFVRGNTADTELVDQILKEHSIEAVLHFAAFIEVGESVADPEKYYRNNFSAAVSLLGSMARAGVKKFVFSSTAATYGNPIRTPIDESHPNAPINPYGMSKRMVEIALEDFRKAYDLGYTCLRYFNVAGASPDGKIGEAHEPESHLIPRILLAARDGQAAAQIFGTDYDTKDGTCVRDYIHVVDLVEAHVLALNSSQPGLGRFYNLGSESGFTVKEVIAACERVTGRKLTVEEKPRRAGDPAVLVASSARIREELGWERKYPDLETIIGHAWQWHTTHPRGYKS